MEEMPIIYCEECEENTIQQHIVQDDYQCDVCGKINSQENIYSLKN